MLMGACPYSTTAASEVDAILPSSVEREIDEEDKHQRVAHTTARQRASKLYASMLQVLDHWQLATNCNLLKSNEGCIRPPVTRITNLFTKQIQGARVCVAEHY